MSHDNNTYTPMSWLPHKSINHTRVQELLSSCETMNKFTNGGPITNYLESLIRQLLVVESKKCVVVCSSATTGLHALTAAMEYYSGISNTPPNLYKSMTLPPSMDISDNSGINSIRRCGRWLTQDFTSAATAQGPMQESIDIYDVDLVYGGISMKALERLEENGEQHQVSGLICTNVFGNVVDIDKYQEWCHRNGDKWLVLDNAATPYTFYKGRNSVNYGNGAVVSFNHSKPIGFGEGGVIIADIELEQTIRRMINFGIMKPKNPNTWLRIGSNYKMSDISAAYIIQYLEDNFNNIVHHHTSVYLDALKYIISHNNQASNNTLSLYPNFADLPPIVQISKSVQACVSSVNTVNTEDGYGENNDCINMDIKIVPSCILLLGKGFTEEYIEEVNKAYDMEVRKYYYPLTNRPNAKYIYDGALCHPVHLDMNTIQIPDPELVKPLDTTSYNINLQYIRLDTALDTIPLDIRWPDVYYTPEYGRAAQETYPGSIWECCIATVSNNNPKNITNKQSKSDIEEPYYLVHCYLLRPTDPPTNIYTVDDVVYTLDVVAKQHPEQYYDLITPMGYLGPSGSPRMIRHFSEAFMNKFAESARERGYLTQVVRRSPYGMPQPIASIRWHKIASKATYSVPISRLKTIEEYMDSTSSSQRRAVIKAKKAGLEFTIEKYKYDWEDDSPAQKLIEMYNNTIERISANKAYQFTDAYFSYLGKLSEKYPGSVYLAQVFMPSLLQLPINNTHPIAMAIILTWPVPINESDKPTKYFHYHLGGFLPEYADRSPINYLYYKVIEYAIEQPQYSRPQLFHLGGGICTGDSLEQLHAKVALEHQPPLQYTIYGEVFNDVIYQQLENEYLESGLTKHKTNGNLNTTNTNTTNTTSTSTTRTTNTIASISNETNNNKCKKTLYRKRAKKYKYFPVYKENDHGI